MNVDNFFKKIYTVAFRLTGDENKAASLAFEAICSSYTTINLSNKLTADMVNKSAKEVCKLFLLEPANNKELFKGFDKNTYTESFQEALMSLNPLSRTTIVWRDVLGLNLEEMYIGHSKSELYNELNNGRRLIKEFLNKYIE